MASSSPARRSSYPVRLDDEVREQMLQEALDQFFDDRVSKIKNGEGDSLDPFHYDPGSHDPTAHSHFRGTAPPLFRLQGS